MNIIDNILWIVVLILAILGAGTEVIFKKEHANIWRVVLIGFAVILILILTRL